jgi:hypothetical protein
MRDRIRLFNLTAIGLLLLGSCATITKGSEQDISITSNVNGANVFLDDVIIGTTPFKGTVKKGKNEIRVEKAGYQTETIVLSTDLEGMFWGNILIGGFLGSTTDITTGSAYTYAPATYQVDLKGKYQTSLEFGQRSDARKFAMIYIDEISRELAAGGGDHLTALAEILNTNESAATTKSSIRAALQESAGDQVRFGAAIADMV